MNKYFLKYFAFNQENNYEPIQGKKLVIGFLVLVMLFNAGLQFLNCYLLKQHDLTANLNTINIINEINKIRSNYGLEPLAENPKLDIAALLKAQDMIENDYFNHYSPEGKTPWDWITSAQYNYKYAGENLALNFFDDQETVRAWLNSPTHKENILNPNYKDTGVAILTGITPTTKEQRTVVVQMFGTEKNKIIIKENNKITTTTLAPQTTKAVVSTTNKITTTSTTFVSTTSTSKIVNAIVSESIKNIKKENQVTLLKNIAPVLYKQSEQQNKINSVKLKVIYEMIKPKTTKIINNSFGLGLLFLGIFGIININTNNSITNIFRKKLLVKNVLILIIGFGFLLNNITLLIYKIRIPTI